MRYHKLAVFVSLSAFLLAVAGCGSSNTGNQNDPLAGGGGTGPGGGPGTVTNGRILFTSAAGMAPDEQTNLLDPASKEVDPAIITSLDFLQLIPFKVDGRRG